MRKHTVHTLRKPILPLLMEQRFVYNFPDKIILFIDNPALVRFFDYPAQIHRTFF